MPDIQTLEDWKCFESLIQDISAQNLKNKTWEKIIFRGQSRAEWKLESSLERFSKKSFSFDDYQKLIEGYLKNPIFSFTEGRVDLIGCAEHHPILPKFPEYMVYLRHHGFPSPLLDWTESPYIAAFFAFSGVTNQQIERSDYVKIYSYQAFRPSTGKTFQLDKPHIQDVGGNLKAHRRHHIQQCRYTFCKKEADGTSIYCSHESATQQTGGDVISEYQLPCKARDEFLRKLDLMNINSFTLFGNEEGLMTMLAYRLRYNNQM